MDLKGSLGTQFALVAGLVGLTAFLFLSAALVGPLLLLIFAGVMLAVFFRGLGDLLAARTGLSAGASHAAVVIGLVGVGLSGAWLLAPRMVDQVGQLMDKLPALLAQAEAFLESSRLGRQFLHELQALAGNNGESPGPVTGLLSITLQTVVYAFIVFITGLYLSVNPGWYASGVVRLFPQARRPLVLHTLREMNHTLRWYLIGRAVSMLAVGLLTAIGLWLMDIPLAMLLGIVAGLLTFVPYAGPIAAGVPIAIVALLESPAHFVWALVYYTVVQSVEGFLITPLVQQRAILLPPAITIVSELVMGVLFGAIGVIVSVPLAAALMVFVRVTYVEAALEGKRPPAATGATSPQLPQGVVRTADARWNDRDGAS